MEGFFFTILTKYRQNGPTEWIENCEIAKSQRKIEKNREKLTMIEQNDKIVTNGQNGQKWFKIDQSASKWTQKARFSLFKSFLLGKIAGLFEEK